MQLLFEKPNRFLVQALQLVSGIVERKQIHPILANVYIEVKDGRLQLTTSDIDVQVQCSVVDDVCVEKFTPITVRLRKLLDVLKSHSDDTLIRIYAADNRSLLLKAEKGSYVLQTLPAENFPLFEGMQHVFATSAQFQVTQKVLRCMLARVQFAMASQEFRFYLNGVFLEIKKNQLSLVATDVHRLSLSTFLLPQNMPEVSCIIPRKTVLELTRLLKDTEEPVDIKIAHSCAYFSFSGITLITKLIEGRYPDYRTALVNDYKETIIFNRALLLKAVQRVAILADEKIKGIRFIFSKGMLQIVSTNADNEKAQEDVSIVYQGRVIDIGYNSVYIVECLQCLHCEDVFVEISPSNNSLRITTDEEAAFQYYVMPMKI